METVQERRKGATRIRVGVCLVILSWLPIAQTLIWWQGLSGDSAAELRGIVWGIQVLVGLVGLAVAGRETIAIAKSVGWRQMPRSVWALLRSPNV